MQSMETKNSFLTHYTFPKGDFKGTYAGSNYHINDKHGNNNISSFCYFKKNKMFCKKSLSLFIILGNIWDCYIGSLAQSVEHRAFNPLVVRSNRTRPTSS